FLARALKVLSMLRALSRITWANCCHCWSWAEVICSLACRSAIRRSTRSSICPSVCWRGVGRALWGDAPEGAVVAPVAALPGEDCASAPAGKASVATSNAGAKRVISVGFIRAFPLWSYSILRAARSRALLPERCRHDLLITRGGLRRSVRRAVIDRRWWRRVVNRW